MRSVMGAVAVAVAACATQTTAGPAPEELIPAEQAVTHEREFWRRVVETGYAIPSEGNVDVLVQELVGYLSSTDPELRDGFAYSILADWIYRQDRVPPPLLTGLAADLAKNLALPPEPDDENGVFKRSFSALLLSVIIARDTREPVLPEAEISAIVDATVAYAQSENDLRGWVEGNGWAHAAAHTADLIRWLARDSRVTRDQLRRLLDATASLVTRHHGFILSHGEDGRLASAVVATLERNRVDEQSWAAWVDRLRPALSTDPQPSLDRLDVAAYAAQRNVRNLVFSLYVQLGVAPEPTPAATELQQALTKLIRGQ